MELRYGDYLKLDSLLCLQNPLTPTEYDENLFIIMHQVCELWFKQLLLELTFLKQALNTLEIFNIIHTLKRIKAILKVLVCQFDVFETLSSKSFFNFRKNLGSTSGFQSLQFREIEFLLGFKNKAILNCFSARSEEKNKLEDRLNETSIWEDFLKFCVTNISQNTKDFFVGDEKTTREVLLFIYQNPSICTEIAEMILDVDEGFQEWRYRHVKMTERAIGHGVQGTGGSSGLDYLKKSLFQSFCSELWEVRGCFQ